ncbi:hypothetical protein WG622_12680 [Cognatishimia sp. D5M38]|uniref:Uncharacterized protein n=1 Tax=Cognatishimia coralii TaxID=3083254 RepID=A0ABU8QI77_9RHOB
MNSKKLIGKIVELRLPEYFVYGICTHDQKEMGQIVFMFDQKFHTRLTAMQELLDLRKYKTHFRLPLKYILNEPEINIVAERELTELEAILPTFRQAGIKGIDDPEEGWWLVKGQQSIWISSLKKEMASFPPDGFPSLSVITDWYDQNIYPHSPSELKKGPLDFKIVLH